MNELTQRFLSEISNHVGYDKVVEVHLFSPIRQGGQESGVAVVAALPEVAETVDVDDDELVEDGSAEEDSAKRDAVEEDELGPEDGEESATGEPEELADPSEVEAEAEAEAEIEDGEDGESPVIRHVVYTARYRSMLKGPDRGKWDFDIKAEADAPLITVDEVVRGVGLRSGDAGMPECISRDEFRATVPAPEGFESEPVFPPHPGTPQPDTLPV